MFAAASVLSLLVFAAVVSVWVRSHWRNDYWSKAVQIQVPRGVSTLESVYVESSAGGIAMGRRAESFNSYGMSSVKAWEDRGVRRYSIPARGYPLPRWSIRPLPPSRPPWWTQLGFHYFRNADVDSWGLTRNNLAVVVPYWSLAALTSVLPASWWLSTRKRRRRAARARRGLCPGCGYDLRDSPDRCPECGESIPTGLERRPVSGSRS